MASPASTSRTRAHEPALARAPLGALAGAALFGAVAFVLGACSDSKAAPGHGGSSGPATAAAADSEAVFGELPEFRVTTQDGETLTKQDLLGRPWVMACIFTMCNGPCPAITREVKKLTKRLEGVDVRFISLSVDPKRDKPHVLKAYAESYEADLSRWSFVTSDPAQIGELVRGGFKLPFAELDEPDPETGDRLTHDQRLTVIDAQGRIRGWYDSQDAEQRKLCVERLRFLAAQE